MKKYIYILFVILMCSTPVAANVTYPQEYYDLGKISDPIFKEQNNIVLSWTDSYNMKHHWDVTEFADNIGSFASLISARELRRQTILMEKQNELQLELVKAQWVETCYAPRSGYAAYSNYSAWKSECANAGYPVGRR